MNRRSLVFAVAILLQAQVLLAQPLYTCGPGAVRSVRLVADVLAVPTGEGLSAGGAGSQARYVVAVELDDLVYTGVSSAEDPSNLDPADLDVREAVSVCASRTDFVVDRGDGTDYRAHVVQVRRQPRLRPERLTEAAPPQPAPQRVARESGRPSARP